jgi:hypothetical protein
MLHSDKSKTVQELFEKGYSIESILFDRMNWNLLGHQKQTLLHVIDYFANQLKVDIVNDLYGILYTIDLFQDAAVDSGYVQEKTVFGYAIPD